MWSGYCAKDPCGCILVFSLWMLCLLSYYLASVCSASLMHYFHKVLACKEWPHLRAWCDVHWFADSLCHSDMVTVFSSTAAMLGMQMVRKFSLYLYSGKCRRWVPSMLHWLIISHLRWVIFSTFLFWLSLFVWLAYLEHAHCTLIKGPRLASWKLEHFQVTRW